MNVIFTICSANFIRRARVLLDSAARTTPGCKTYLFLVDRTAPPEARAYREFCRPHEVINTDKIGIADYPSMTFQYNLVEMNTAVKASVCTYLFARGADKVLYLDPDILVFSSLSRVFTKLDECSIILTPHEISPHPPRAHLQNEVDSRLYGIMNLGFVAIRRNTTGEALCNWWEQKLLNTAFVDRHYATAYDQKWMDYCGALFGEEVYVEREPGFNVATWNLHEREIVQQETVFQVEYEGRLTPLYFFHFSGYAPGSEYLNWRWPKSRLKEQTPLQALAHIYDEKIRACGHEELDTREYGYGRYSNGVRIQPFQRRFFRQCRARVTNPFDAGGSFYRALKKRGLLSDTVGVKELGVCRESTRNSWVEKVFTRALLVAQRVLGIKRYLLLLEGFFKYSRIENNVFLLGPLRREEKRD